MNCRWTGLIVAIALIGNPCFAGEPLAQDPKDDVAGPSAGQDPTQREGKPSDRPRRPRPGQGPGIGQREMRGDDQPQRDIGQVVSMLIRQFDADGDEKLDSAELTNMLTTIRQRPGLAGFLQGGRPQQRPGGEKARRPQNDVSDEAGGVTPARPPIK